MVLSIKFSHLKLRDDLPLECVVQKLSIIIK